MSLFLIALALWFAFGIWCTGFLLVWVFMRGVSACDADWEDCK